MVNSQETSTIPKNELGDSQLDSLENNTWEVIEDSDLDEIQVAGFSKQELLEMCNFCKISYGNNDDKLAGEYKTKAGFVNEGYKIIPFYYSERNRRLAGFVFTKDEEVTIAYRGTKDLDDVVTDVNAAFTSELSSEGEKMHSGFYNAFKDSWRSLEEILNDYAKEQESEIKSFRINCTGHSMGAALATITALYLKKVRSAEHVRVATFGSPRVFDSRGAEIYEELLGENTIRVTNLSDPVPMFPSGSMGFKHVGKPLKIKTGNFIVSCFVTDFCVAGRYYHKTDAYYSCIQGIKPEDFQSDNNVSRYYYLSYVVAVPYYITTTALATPCYLFLSAISSAEQCYFEREIKFAGDRRLMSLKDDKGRLVIHALGNTMVSSKNPLIIPIGCNINGKSEELQFNISNISPFISNYHLNGNNMGLRQLCGVTNVSVKEVPNLISAENRVPGKSAASNLINELATPSQAVSDKQSQNPEPKSQHVEKNVLEGKEKNDTIGSIAAPKEKSVSNNYKGGEMYSDDQNTKTIEEKLYDAILSLDLKEVESLVEQIKQENNDVKRIINGALKEAKEIKIKKKNKNSQGELEKIREFLEEECKNINADITASLLDDSATTSSQEIPVNIDEEEQAPDQPVEPGSKDNQLDPPWSSTDDDSNALSSTKLPESDKNGTDDSSNGKYVKVPSDSNSGSPFESVDEESKVTESEITAPVTATPAAATTVSAQMSSAVTEEAEINNGQSNNPNNVDAPVLQVAPNAGDEDQNQVLNPQVAGDNQQDLVVLSAPGESEDQKPVPGQPTGHVPHSNDSDKKGTQTKPEPVPQGNGAKGGNKQPNSPGKNDPAPQSTKNSKWPVIAASALAVAGVALGVAIAVHLEMLAVGIAVGACCLVAATVVYCCRPQSLVEDNSVEKVVSEEKEPAPV